MDEERLVTEVEKAITKNRREKMTSPDKVFGMCGIKALSDVYRDCGGKAACLYFALVGNTCMAGANKSFKLFNSFVDATGLGKADLSKATTKLETKGYITVERSPGHKNSFTMTEKGRLGLVSRR